MNQISQFLIPALMLLAGTATAENCVSIKEPAARLACYDQQAGRATETADPSEFHIQDVPPAVRFMLKSDTDPITPENEGKAKPAELSLARRSNEAFVDANVALIGQFIIGHPDNAWSGFGAAQWTRKEKSNELKDTRAFALGLQYASQTDQLGEDFWWFAAAPKAEYSKDIAKRVDTASLGLVLDFGRRSWLDSSVPFFGTFGIRRQTVDAVTVSDTQYSSVYLLGDARWAPERLQGKAELSLRGGYFNDIDAPNQASERDGWFGILSASYKLYEGKPAWRPELRLSRSFGKDPLNVNAINNETRLTLAVLFDSLYLEE